ncbi:unnamed protein product [Caenorhabditis auriculariae]|uniref:Importin subunit alpha n=1 Tax=Caenorhabditis auriculariae TaxID=2777116 RepID=A0A8S1H6H7_9PELO|nr:unnamed protein product [Caenorhabditis auriculariae]
MSQSNDPKVLENGDNGDDSRMKQYKNLNKHEDLRRRRTECSVEIRKKKGDEMLMKRRNINVNENDDEEDAEETFDDFSDVEKPVVSKGTPRYTYEEVKSVLFNNPDLEQTIKCFESLRKILSKTRTPPIEEFIQSGLMAALVQALSIENDKIRYEACWALTNIVSGTSEQTIAAVNAGATEPLIKLAVDPNEQVADQALWAIANIAGDSPQLRNYVIKVGGIEVIMHLVAHLDKLSLNHARTLAWTISNISRHKEAPLSVLRQISVALAQLVKHEDKQVRQDSCWAVAYMTDGPDQQIELCISSGTINTVVEFLRDADQLVAPALRTLGNVATGCDKLTQEIIDRGVLPEIVSLLKRTSSTSIVKECCWLISNVIAGTQGQIQAVIDSGLLGFVIGVLKKGDFKSQIEASWALSNLTQGGTSKQIYAMVEEKGVEVLSICLGQNATADMQNNCLEALYSCLTTVSTHYPEKLDLVRDSIEANGGLDALEKLQGAEVQEIYTHAYKIISEFFSDDELDADHATDENSAPPAYSF